MNALSKILFSTLLIVSLSGCASIVSRSSWPLTVVTNPNGVRVEISDRNGYVVFNGVSPATLQLKSGADFFQKESYRVKLNLEGFPERIIPIECSINGWYFGNLLFGGILGILIVDPATGAMFKLDRNYIYESFEQPQVNNTTVKILNLNEISENMKNHLVALK